MTQPEALRLADSISRIDTLTEHQRSELLQAAAELRRLYRVSDDLRDSLNHTSYYQLSLTKHMRARKEQMMKMKVQRDELLDALKEMLAVWEEDPAYGHASAEKARAAIAKAQQ